MKNVILFLLSVCLLTACGTTATTKSPTTHTIPLELAKLPKSDIYINMDYGIRLNVLDKRASKNVLNKYDANPLEMKTRKGSASKLLSANPIFNTYPEIIPFISESMTTYMQTMGFDLNADINTDYLFQIEVSQFQLSYLSGTGWVGSVVLDLQIFDESKTQVYPRTTVTGRKIVSGAESVNANSALNEAYVNALENIDWNRVAYFLRRAQSASGEKNKQVQGKGDTALEHTVIRWFIDSAPKGADVQWRVVSSTPDVKNTNQNYLGSTPYESTETFDIKGLTFNNSGNIQIEVSCEKPGYITQKKRFNLRQAIEQKEISTKFNLIKEE